MTFQKTFVVQKLDAITEYTKELKDLLRFSDTKIFADYNKLHSAERIVQLIVDTMIDTNQHFIRELNLNIPDDLQGTFSIMGENNILPKEFAKKIALVTGLRNILVHQYEKLDKELFMRNVRKNFPDFQKYQKYIYKYLKRTTGE